jgi:hypothetical protein
VGTVYNVIGWFRYLDSAGAGANTA